jgi:myo-inositol 2-dehydrogenase/D-chiro-inositol 1-dehydrogenase
LAHSGGLVRDMLIHDLDELVWMFGDGPLTVTAQLAPFVDPALANLNDHDAAAVTIAYADGPVCHISASRHCSYGLDQRMEVFGSSGLVSCPNMATRHTTVATEIGFLRGPLHESFGERYAAAYEAELESFLDTIEGLVPPLCPVGDARMSLALAELVMDAHRTRTTVSSATLKHVVGEIAAS